MSGDSSGPKAQALKCTECGAKISPEDVQPGMPIVCSYCGALIVISRPAAPLAGGGFGPRAGLGRPGLRFAGPRGSPTPRLAEYGPFVNAMKLLVDKGAIDGKVLREHTKRNLDHHMQPPIAFRAALVQMKNEGKLSRDKMMRAIDELVAEQKVPPRAHEIVDRLFS